VGVYTGRYFNFNRNFNFNFKLLKTSKGASPLLRLPVCGRFEVAVEVEVEVEKSPLHEIPNLRFTRMRFGLDRWSPKAFFEENRAAPFVKNARQVEFKKAVIQSFTQQ
jgi:hypothetical protein